MLKKIQKKRYQKSHHPQRNPHIFIARAPHPPGPLKQVPNRATPPSLPPQNPWRNKTPAQGQDSVKRKGAWLRSRWQPLSISPWRQRLLQRNSEQPSSLAAITSPTPATGSCTLSITATMWNWTHPSILQKMGKMTVEPASLPLHWYTGRRLTSGVPLNLWQNQLPKKAKLSQKPRSLNLLYQRTQQAVIPALLQKKKSIQ